MSRLRAAQRQFVRADQTEPISRPQYNARPSLCAAASQRLELTEQGAAHTLRLETREHSPEEPRKPNHQNHRFRLGLRRATDSLYVYSVQILPVSGSTLGPAIFVSYRHVVLGLHCRRAFPWSTLVPWLIRVQPSVADHRDAWLAADVDARDGQAVGRVF